MASESENSKRVNVGPCLSRFVDIPGEFQNFGYLHKFLYKLFMQVRFDQNDFDLDSVEKEIICLILEKKEFKNHERVQFTAEFFNFCSASEFEKKKEDGLKFVFKKALKHLISAFKTKLAQSGQKINQNHVEWLFYEHFFGKVSRDLNIRLERFFHFRNWRNRFSELIPKSITKEYVAHIKLSADFISRFREFLNRRFMEVFFDWNMSKIKRLVGTWDKMLTSCGHAGGLSEIKRKLFKSGNKMPWTLSEAKKALEHTFDYLK